jgi:mannose-6-phosphate isomerase-like protein (cupin superfamily)
MSTHVDKPWGHEEIWACTGDYVGKVLVILKGHRLSLQHHEIKEETIRIAEGTMQLELEDENGTLQTHVLQPGDSRHIAPGRRHRMFAVTDVKVYEVSTPHLKDVVRHQDDYGRA